MEEVRMGSSAETRRLSVHFLVIVLFGAVFMAAFAVVTSPTVLADPGDPVISGQVTDNSTSGPIA
ncbi:MAG: hypothetical protein LN413_02275, partial [Candidatus Thermoplasmatota archaeon]|nr:hypothetical protein [Candidatus Thermoplasmatota archaeon]